MEPSPPFSNSTSVNPISVDLPTPSCVLAIGAHPDDIELQCGATLAKWAAGGTIVHHLILTDGSKGTWDPDADTVALVATRQQEQRRSARTLGASGEVVMLGVTDGDLQSGLELRDRVALWIRRLRPDVVLGHDPWKRYRLHPDHRHAGWLTVDGLVVARDPHFLKDHGIAHHRPSALLLFEADEPNHAEDVSGFAEVKIAALLEHRSQLESTMAIRPDDDGTDLGEFKSRIHDELMGGGFTAGVAEAELFRLLAQI